MSWPSCGPATQNCGKKNFGVTSGQKTAKRSKNFRKMVSSIKHLLAWAEMATAHCTQNSAHVLCRTDRWIPFFVLFFAHRIFNWNKHMCVEGAMGEIHRCNGMVTQVHIHRFTFALTMVFAWLSSYWHTCKQLICEMTTSFEAYVVWFRRHKKQREPPYSKNPSTSIHTIQQHQGLLFFRRYIVAVTENRYVFVFFYFDPPMASRERTSMKCTVLCDSCIPPVYLHVGLRERLSRNSTRWLNKQQTNKITTKALLSVLYCMAMIVCMHMCACVCMCVGAHMHACTHASCTKIFQTEKEVSVLTLV